MRNYKNDITAAIFLKLHGSENFQATVHLGNVPDVFRVLRQVRNPQLHSLSCLDILHRFHWDDSE